MSYPSIASSIFFLRNSIMSGVSIPVGTVEMPLGVAIPLKHQVGKKIERYVFVSGIKFYQQPYFNSKYH